MRKINGSLLIGLMLLVSDGALPTYSQSSKEQYELQERCGKRAAAEFKNEFPEGSVSKTKDGQMTTNYQNHYNARLNKCFYLSSSVIYEKRDGKTVTNKVMRLYDLNENNEYGTFAGELNDPFVLCAVEDRLCSSENEWRQLIKPYMEE